MKYDKCDGPRKVNVGDTTAHRNRIRRTCRAFSLVSARLRSMLDSVLRDICPLERTGVRCGSGTGDRLQGAVLSRYRKKGHLRPVFPALFAWSVLLAEENWGSVGVIAAFISYSVFVFGVLGLWSVLGDWTACRTLKLARLVPAWEVTSGERVALSGRLQVQGLPLTRVSTLPRWKLPLE